MPVLQRVLTIIAEIARDLPYHGLMLNERYIHHYFSNRLQEHDDHAPNLLNVMGPAAGIMLHPEWPTYKEATGLDFGRYRKIDGQYRPVDDGQKGGFLDFAVGDYNSPEIGIEFKLKPSWSNTGIVYDFVKLLDSRNRSLMAVVSFTVILRPNGLPMGNYVQYFQDLAHAAYQEAVDRLGHWCCGDERRRWFIFSEIATDARRNWLCDNANGVFGPIEQIPVPPANAGD